jgi:hypothetical protein
MAIRRIKAAEKDTPNMSPVERVYKYELTNPPATLVEDLYTEICTRDEALSDAEWDQLDSLGGNQGRRVHRAREALLKARVRGRLGPEQKKSIVCEFLGLDTRRTFGSPPSTPNPTGEFMRFSLSSLPTFINYNPVHCSGRFGCTSWPGACVRQRYQRFSTKLDCYTSFKDEHKRHLGTCQLQHKSEHSG